MNSADLKHLQDTWTPRSSGAAGLAGIVASSSMLTLVTLLFWNVSRHSVDGPSYIARMQHCETLLAGAKRQCIDQTFATVSGQIKGRRIAAAGDRLPGTREVQ